MIRELYLQSIRRGTMATPVMRSGLRGISLADTSRVAARRKSRRGILRGVKGMYSGVSFDLSYRVDVRQSCDGLNRKFKEFSMRLR